MNKRLLRSFGAALLCATLQVHAQTQVIPAEYTTTDGNGTFNGPLGNSARTYQLLLDSTVLGSLNGKTLTGISFRSPVGTTAPWPPVDAVYNNYAIWLSPSVPPANRSFTFANNIAGTRVQVRSGQLIIPDSTYPAGGPNSFGPVITFNQPYAYNGGNLLLEIRHNGSNTTFRSINAVSTLHQSYGNTVSAIWANGDTASVTTTQANAIIVRFSFDNPLPVGLLGFDAEAREQQALLSWQTASEQNSAWFEIERSIDGQHFRFLDKVKAAGNSSTKQQYHYTDPAAGAAGKRVYYRLKMTDRDNSFTYSSVASVEMAGVNPVTLYPNPAGNEVSLSFVSTGGAYTVSIRNMAGQEVLRKSYRAAAGLNKQAIGLSGIVPGLYVLHVDGVISGQAKLEKK